MKYIWRQINVGFGVEWARWTAVDIQNRQPKTDLSFDETNEVIQDESSIGVITDSRDSFVSKRWAEWEISGNIETNSIWYLFYSLLWEVSSEVDTTWAYKHTFVLKETNQSPSLTIGVSDPVIWEKSFSLWMIESMTINAEEWEQAKFTIDLKSKPSDSASHTVVYNVDNKLLSRHSIFKVAENLAGLWTANAICLKSFEITINKNLEEDFCLWNISPVDFINKQFSIEWSFTALFTSTEFREYQLDGEHKAISFELKDTANEIGVSSNPSLKISLPLVSFIEFDRTQWNDEVVIQTLTFKWLYSNVDTSSIEVELINTVEEYEWESV